MHAFSPIMLQAYVHVININQHSPRFLENLYEAHIPEDTPPWTEIISVRAADKDHGKGLIYTIASSVDSRSMKLFHMDPSSGTLMTVMGIDYQSMAQHTLTVMVRMTQKNNRSNTVHFK